MAELRSALQCCVRVDYVSSMSTILLDFCVCVMAESLYIGRNGGRKKRYLSAYMCVWLSKLTDEELDCAQKGEKKKKTKSRRYKRTKNATPIL